MTIRLTNGKREEIYLYLARLYKIDRVLVNNRSMDVKREADGFTLDDLPSDTVFEVIVEYSGSFPGRSEFSTLTPEKAILREEEFLPHGPKKFDLVRLAVMVPRDWGVIAPGRRIRIDTTADASIHVWESTQLLSTIGWIVAGKFRTFELSGSAISMTAHVLSTDSTRVHELLILARRVLHFYSSTFSPYRFPKLDIVEVDDWVAGGNVLAIAVPSFIMLKTLALTTDDKLNRAESVLPHEVAHQWWPATVFAENEDAAFLSEGMCEYSALMYREEMGALERRDSLGSHPLLRSLILSVQKGEDVPLHGRADLRYMPTHYLKSAFVHHMLRRLIGDSVFTRLYHEYATRFAEKSTTIAEYRNLAEELSHRRLDWFFDQWVMHRGLPRLKVYNVKTVHTGSTWVTRGRVRILGYDKYTTSIDVAAIKSDKRAIARLHLGVDSTGVYRNDVPFEIITAEKPTEVRLDPDGDILKIQKLPVKLGDLREPSNGVMIVGTGGGNAEYLYARARSDSAAMDRSWWSMTIKPDTMITLADLQAERIFLYGKQEDNRIVADLVEKFPLQFKGDSVRLEGGTLFDSTLTLIQAIESPYHPQGSIVWLAPLSPKAQPELLPYDASWTIVRGKEEISSGVWQVEDTDLVVKIR